MIELLKELQTRLSEKNIMYLNFSGTYLHTKEIFQHVPQMYHLNHKNMDAM